MPELPEVETFVRTLRNGVDGQPSILGMVISSADVYWPKTLAVPGPEKFFSLLPGQSIVDISRRGKFLVFQLSHHSLLIHLRMSGDLVLVPPSEVTLPRHTRMALHFKNGWHLAFNDPRKFGRVWLLDDPQEVLGSLGREPLDSALSESEFHLMMNGKGRLLKPLLLDQTFLAGIGNIYSDEALNMAKLHPLRKASSLNRIETDLLLQSLRNVLSEGIKRNGSSIDWVYRGGEFQNNFRVYGRTDEPCPECGTPITHLKVGQRSTHVCSKCQKLEE